METATLDTELVKTASLFQSIPIDQIKPSAHQARKVFNSKSLQELADSMREEGQLQPILVRQIVTSLRGSDLPGATVAISAVSNSEIAALSPTAPPRDDKPVYELISGERRLRAAKLLGWTRVEARVIKTVSEGEAAAKGLVENLQREDLNPIDEAEGLQELNQLDPKYWTLEKIGTVCGKGKSAISESLRLLELPETIKQKVRTCELFPSHGELLLRLPVEQRETMAKAIEKNGWNVRDTEKRVNEALNKEPKAKSGKKVKEDSLKDPLAGIWPKIKMDEELVSLAAWDASYGLHKFADYKAPPEKGWCFWVSVLNESNPKELAHWFRKMAALLEKQ